MAENGSAPVAVRTADRGRKIEHLGRRLDREISVKTEPAQAPQFNAVIPAATTFAYQGLATGQQAAAASGEVREQVKTTTTAIISIGRDLIAVKQNLLEHGQHLGERRGHCGLARLAIRLPGRRVAKGADARPAGSSFRSVGRRIGPDRP